jgi:hypothetical protein
VKGTIVRMVVTLEPPPPAKSWEELATLSNKDLRNQARIDGRHALECYVISIRRCTGNDHEDMK